MPYPQTGTERARPDIAETFEEFDLEANMMALVASQVLPIREVQFAHGVYPQVEIKELMRNPVGSAVSGDGKALRRSPKGAYFRDDLSFIETPYTTVEYGSEGPVDDNEAAHYASVFDHESTVAQWQRHRLMVQYEKRVASEAFSTTRFAGQTAAASVGWDTPATADPVGDVRAARIATVGTYGIWPDTIVMNRIAWTHLIATDQIRELVHAQGAGTPDRARLITQSVVAQALDLDEIIVAGGIEDTANASAAFSGDHIWGKSALVFKKIRGRSIREIGLGHTFHWAADSSMPGGFVEQYREPQVRAEIIRVRHQTAEIFKLNLGYLITAVYA